MKAARAQSSLSKGAKICTMIVLGSGGHTAEMLSLLQRLDPARYYAPAHFVLADTDTTSLPRVSRFIDSIKTAEVEVEVKFHRIQRSREVGQSWGSTLWSTLGSTLQSLRLVYRMKPDLVLCNGPGTCIPICVGAYLLRVFGMHNPTIVFIESFCRVEGLSLTGKLLYPVADRFIVQWKQLADPIKRPRCEYVGAIF